MELSGSLGKNVKRWTTCTAVGLVVADERERVFRSTLAGEGWYRGVSRAQRWQTAEIRRDRQTVERTPLKQVP